MKMLFKNYIFLSIIILAVQCNQANSLNESEVETEIFL